MRPNSFFVIRNKYFKDAETIITVGGCADENNKNVHLIKTKGVKKIILSSRLTTFNIKLNS